ncbi:hypothetical protein PG984_009563 [Apiospora sp. TS-2023a]
MEENGIIPLPQGKVHDFHGTTYIQILVVTLFDVTFSLATVVLILRIYTSVRIVKRPDLSDPIPHGLGRHLWDVTAQQLAGYYKYTLLIYLTYIWTPTLCKLVILVLYRQINPFRPSRICVYVTAAGIIVYTVVFTTLICSLCKPVSEGRLTCLNNIAIAQAVVNILTDILLIVLPIPMLRQLHLPRRQKMVVGGILGLGSARMTLSSDVTWAQASLAIWSSIELNFGIACNCLARLRPFVRAHMPTLERFLGHHNNSDATPDLAAAPVPSHGQQQAIYTFRLHSLGGDALTDVEGESGQVHVRREVTVDLESTEAASRRIRSTDKLIRQ